MNETKEIREKIEIKIAIITAYNNQGVLIGCHAVNPYYGIQTE